ALVRRRHRHLLRVTVVLELDLDRELAPRPDGLAAVVLRLAAVVFDLPRGALEDNLCAFLVVGVRAPRRRLPNRSTGGRARGLGLRLLCGLGRGPLPLRSLLLACRMVLLTRILRVLLLASACGEPPKRAQPREKRRA